MSGPLEGVRILAISQFGAGPYGTQVLADLGAEVIKIEDPLSGGDVARYVPPFEIEQDSLYFQSFNRGKKSVAINLRNPDGFHVFRDLVRVSDAVFNNLRGDLAGEVGSRLRRPAPPEQGDSVLFPVGIRHGWTAEGPARVRRNSPGTLRLHGPDRRTRRPADEVRSFDH